MVTVASVWLLWKIQGPDGISPVTLFALGAFMYFIGVPVLAVVRVIVVETVSFDLWVPYVVIEVAEAIWGSRKPGEKSAIERLRQWKADRQRESHSKRETCARRESRTERKVVSPHHQPLRWKAALLIEHTTGKLVALRTYYVGRTSRYAMKGLLETVDVEGRVITLDLVDVRFRAIKALVDRRADFVFYVNNACPFAYRILSGMNWEMDSVRRYDGRWTLRDCETIAERRVRGRRAMRGLIWEQIKIEVCSTGPYALPFRHASQAFRATVRAGKTRKRPAITRVLYGITSLSDDRAKAWELLVLLQRHKARANSIRQWQMHPLPEHRERFSYASVRFDSDVVPVLAMVVAETS